MLQPTLIGLNLNFKQSTADLVYFMHHGCVDIYRRLASPVYEPSSMEENFDESPDIVD